MTQAQQIFTGGEGWSTRYWPKTVITTHIYMLKHGLPNPQMTHRHSRSLLEERVGQQGIGLRLPPVQLPAFPLQASLVFLSRTCCYFLHSLLEITDCYRTLKIPWTRDCVSFQWKSQYQRPLRIFYFFFTRKKSLLAKIIKWGMNGPLIYPSEKRKL